jgi:hypothetical protein
MSTATGTRRRIASKRISQGPPRSGGNKGLIVTQKEIDDARAARTFIMVKGPGKEREGKRPSRTKGEQTAPSIPVQWKKQWGALVLRGQQGSSDAVLNGTNWYIPSLRVGGLIADLITAATAGSIPGLSLPALQDAMNNMYDWKKSWNFYNTAAWRNEQGALRITIDAFSGKNAAGQTIYDTPNTDFLAEASDMRRQQEEVKKHGPGEKAGALKLSDLQWIARSMLRSSQGVVYYTKDNQIHTKESKNVKLSKNAKELLNIANTARAGGRFMNLSGLLPNGSGYSLKPLSDLNKPESKLNSGSQVLNMYADSLSPIFSALKFTNTDSMFDQVKADIVATSNAMRLPRGLAPVSDAEIAREWARAQEKLSTAAAGTKKAASPKKAAVPTGFGGGFTGGAPGFPGGGFPGARPPSPIAPAGSAAPPGFGGVLPPGFAPSAAPASLAPLAMTGAPPGFGTAAAPAGGFGTR